MLTDFDAKIKHAHILQRCDGTDYGLTHQQCIKMTHFVVQFQKPTELQKLPMIEFNLFRFKLMVDKTQKNWASSPENLSLGFQIR